MPGFFLQSSQDVTVKVHPVVLFSVLEHYIRRNEGQNRVIGTLLGYYEGNELTVTDCYAVPHSEDVETGEIAIGKEYSMSMFELQNFAKIDHRAQIVGWYATTDGIPVSKLTCLIHDFYGAAVENSQPIHMVVNTSLEGNCVSTQCFVSKSITVRGRVAPLAQFQQVKVSIDCPEAERSAMDVMIKGSRNFSEQASELIKKKEKDNQGGEGGRVAVVQSSHLDPKDQPISSDMVGLDRSITRLVDMLKQVMAYVEDVKKGKLPHDDELGRKITNVLGTVSRIDAGSFDKLFNNSLQDLLMVLYLTNLARAQLHIAEKLQST